MKKTVLIATEKPFSKEAIDSIIGILEKKDYEVKTLEKYTDPAQLYDAVADANAIIFRSDKITKEVMNHAHNLEIAVRAGAGYDNVDLAAATEKNIVVENTPGQNSNAVAELAFGLMVMQARNFYNGKPGKELMGKEIGLHGFGAVGRCMARIAHGFGMNVLACDNYLPADVFAKNNVTRIEDPVTLYKNCKYISLHFPATPETIKSVNYKLLSNLPQDGTLINTARAEIIDEDGVLEMFEKRPDFVYIADVAPSNKDVIAEKFPGRYYFTVKKSGAQTVEANTNAGIAAAHQICSFFETGDTKFKVNK